VITSSEKRKYLIKQSIKSAAIQIASEEGWGNVTIRKIASKILYTPPIVYQHFKNKEDLFHQLIKDGFDELHKLSSKYVSEVNKPEEKILQIAAARYDFALMHSTLHSMMFETNTKEWTKSEVMNAMEKIKSIVLDSLNQIAKDKTSINKYFLNLIALITGYIFFAKHLSQDKAALKQMDCYNKQDIKLSFLDAINRFLESLK
jgi:AcrR family transcriptional regulator